MTIDEYILKRKRNSKTSKTFSIHILSYSSTLLNFTKCVKLKNKHKQTNKDERGHHLQPHLGEKPVAEVLVEPDITLETLETKPMELGAETANLQLEADLLARR